SCGCGYGPVLVHRSEGLKLANINHDTTILSIEADSKDAIPSL
ncbi:MAG: hypothetical protein RL431_961, partial [Actinomycetota bacterium]